MYRLHPVIYNYIPQSQLLLQETTAHGALESSSLVLGLPGKAWRENAPTHLFNDRIHALYWGWTSVPPVGPVRENVVIGQHGARHGLLCMPLKITSCAFELTVGKIYDDFSFFSTSCANTLHIPSQPP